MQIDLGSRDGLRVNLPVLTATAWSGASHRSASRARRWCCWAIPTARSAALVENETRDTGVIGPSGPLDTELVELGYLSRNANLKPGADRGDQRGGGIFPKGIPIGKIVDVQPVEYGSRTRGAREAGGQPERAGGSVGAVAMNWLQHSRSCPGRRLPGGVLGGGVRRRAPSAWGRRWTCCRRSMVYASLLHRD